MNDRELLELAAKSAGIEGYWVGGDFNNFVRTYNGYQMGWWNPLTDDGDALRLAVKLELDVSCGDGGCVIHPRPAYKPIYESTINGDPYAATRRAITRAAAEIGKAMP